MPSSERGIAVGRWELAASDAATPDELDAGAPTWIPAQVPGTVAGALLAGGVDPRALPDLDAQAWWYRATFPRDRAEGAATIEATGLATFAEIWVNRERVTTSSNMFLAVSADAGPLDGVNELHLRFDTLRRRWPRAPRARWLAVDRRRDLRWIRTSLLGRAPGFGPPLPPVGPTGGLRVSPAADAGWRDVQIDARLAGGVGELVATALVDAPERPDVELAIAGHGSWACDVEPATPGSWSARAAVSLPGVEPWWPHTHGQPTLHEAALNARWGDDRLPAVTRRIGFRQIALGDGDRFGFAVNGIPTFCRGACWTPLDMVTLEEEPDALAEALDEVCRAGMNMLRVPGGTRYASDALLAACDERGILVWQDFMFWALDYPFADAAFREAAIEEARHVLSRMRGHSCLALLCGSNEHEQRVSMLGGRLSDAREDFFTDTLPELCEELVPGVPYVPSSPSGGFVPFAPDAGCTHYYGVGAYRRPLDDARSSGVRFASECLAFANVPSAPVLDAALGSARSPTGPEWKAGSPRDVGTGWDFDDVRDRYFADVFDADPSALRMTDPERYLELSALVSGEVMARTFALWRDPRTAATGGLVWFLRDLAPGAGWGLVDSSGEPKPALDVLATALQPFAIFLVDDGLAGLTLVAVNDGADALSARASTTVGTFGGAVREQAECEIEIPPRAARAWPLTLLMDRFRDLNHAYRFGPLEHDVVHVRCVAGGRALDAWSFPAPLPVRRDDSLVLDAELREGEAGRTLRLTANRFAQYVAVTKGGRRVARLHVAPWRDAEIPIGDDESPIAVRAVNGGSVTRVQTTLDRHEIGRGIS